MGAGSSPIPAAARMSAGPALVAASAAIAIATPAAAGGAWGGTTSRTSRVWPALVTPIVSGSIWRNQPTRTRRPSMATRRGAPSQAVTFSASRVIGPTEVSRPAIRPGSSASGSRERGHQPPSTAPVPAMVGSSCTRGPGGAAGRVEAAGVLVAAVMSMTPVQRAEAKRVGSWTWLIARCWRPSWIQRALQLLQVAIGYRPNPMVTRADRHSGQRGIRGLLPLIRWCVGGAEQLRVPQVEGAQVGHQAAQLRRLLFCAPGVLLGGEVGRLGELAWPVVVLGQRPAQDVRRVAGEELVVVASEADHALHVVGSALDDLHEPGRIRPAVQVHMDLPGVVGNDPGEMLGGVPPPFALLGPFAVAARVVLGGEADHAQAPAVFGDPGCRPEPAVGAGGELSLPASQVPADPGWVGRPTLGDLDEHGLHPSDAHVAGDVRHHVAGQDGAQPDGCGYQ